jgi:hypothetical protein
MALQETTTPQNAAIHTPMQDECITIIAQSPGQALKEFHRRGLGKQGYAICGRVVPHKFDVINDEGEAEELFDGKHFYSATFFRREEQPR